jgi:hypothetical protein
MLTTVNLLCAIERCTCVRSLLCLARTSCWKRVCSAIRLTRPRPVGSETEQVGAWLRARKKRAKLHEADACRAVVNSRETPSRVAMHCNDPSLKASVLIITFVGFDRGRHPRRAWTR